jgi:hypothetical protein
MKVQTEDLNGKPFVYLSWLCRRMNCQRVVDVAEVKTFFPTIEEKEDFFLLQADVCISVKLAFAMVKHAMFFDAPNADKKIVAQWIDEAEDTHYAKKATMKIASEIAQIIVEEQKKSKPLKSKGKIDAQNIMDYICEKGGSCTKTDVRQRFRTMAIDDILDYLLATEKIKATIKPSKGRPITVFEVVG